MSQVSLWCLLCSARFKRIFRSIPMVFAIFFFSANTGAASFNCARVVSAIEKFICLDYRISDMDSDLARIYERERLTSTRNSSIQASQRTWVAMRNRCTSFACVRDAYLDRISELSPSVGGRYASKRPGSIKNWDYVAPSGYFLSRFLFWDGRLMAEQGELLFPGGWRWVFLDDGKVISRALNDKSPDYLPSFVLKGRMQLGQEFSVSSVGSSMCRTGVGEQGLRVEGRVGFKGGKASRILVALVRGEWIDSEASPDCFEVELNHRRANFIQAAVFENSFYWLERDFILRFDDMLWTQSNLVGEKVFLVWGDELSEMVALHCKVYDRACADKRLLKLISEISYFYK